MKPSWIYLKRAVRAIILPAVILAGMGVAALANPAQAGDEIPAEAEVVGVIGHPQSWTLSCESRSAADWAAYFSADLSEYDILNALPRSDNPETGFVGSPSGVWGNIPPLAYGVHPPPLAKVLRDMSVPAQEQSGFGWDRLRREIAAGKPVIIWVISQMWNGTPIEYTASDGQTTIVAYREHSMILVGYDENTVHVVDAYSGMDEYFGVSAFLNSYAVLGERAITYSGELPEKPTAIPTVAGDYTVQRGETLSAIAQRFGMSWTDLAALNGIGYPYRVYAGQQILIPGEGTEVAVLLTSTVPASPTATATALPPATATQVPSATPSPTATATATPAQPGAEIIVQAGDTLSKIARRYGVALQDLIDANQLPYPYLIYAGQVLKLPGGSGTASPTPTSTAIATATAQPSGDSTYTVQHGDYLIDLARRFGLDWQALAEINGIGYPYRLVPGQVIKLR
jgi:LysM repeat protein/uncharacterized protein YvpB